MAVEDMLKIDPSVSESATTAGLGKAQEYAKQMTLRYSSRTTTKHQEQQRNQWSQNNLIT